MLATITAKLTGTPGFSGWSQVNEFKPDEREKIDARGQLFAVVSTGKEEYSSINTIATGRELVARLHEEYYGELDSKPFHALRSAVEKVSFEFRNIWGEVEIVACSLVSGIVYSVCTGGSEVTIARGGVLGTILKSLGTDVIEASGFPKKGDMMLLASKLFYKKISQATIREALQATSPEAAVEVFGQKVKSEEAGALAAIVIKFDEEGFLSDSVKKPPYGDGLKPTDTFRSKLEHSFATILPKFNRGLFERKIFVKHPPEDEIASQSKKVTFSVALILLCILGVSIVFGFRQKKINDTRGKYQTLLTSAWQDVDEAISLASISPDRSRELFYQSEQKLNQVEEMKVKDVKIVELRKRIDESRGQILGEYVLAEDLFLDLSLLASGFRGDAISVSAGEALILDKSGKRIISVALDTKKSRVVAGPGVLGDVIDVALYERRAFVLEKDGVYEVEDTKTKVIENTWGNAFVKVFAGNVYILDKGASNIYRYSGQGSVFGSQQNWLVSGTNVDFGDAKMWSIDGSVYVLFPNSEIRKFSLGSPQNFSLKGIVPEIGNTDAIFASDENEYIYLLDSVGKRVVVVDKKGNYKSQYINDKVSEATNLVVSEKDKKIIFLVGDKLYSLELEHI